MTALSGSNIALMHTVVSILIYKKIIMHYFSSFKFNLILSTGTVPDNTFVSTLRHTKKVTTLKIKSRAVLISSNKTIVQLLYFGIQE